MSLAAKTVLLGLTEGKDGESWAEARLGWQSEFDDVCSWDGIRCASDGSVKEINLQNTNLFASIPTNIGLLSFLTHVNLSSNHLVGSIPSSLADLPSLVQVDLSMNKLEGQLPMFRSHALESVNLSHNQLHGTLPGSFGDLGGNKLKLFNIKDNRISGVIPPSIGHLSQDLVELDLSNNKFAGPIPHELGSLSKLEGLFLSYNDLSGTIPVALTRSHLALSEIFLHGNSLSGTVPIDLANLPLLETIFIDDNKLTGTVPPELCRLSLNELFFQDAFHGIEGGDVHVNDNYVEFDQFGGRRRTYESFVRDGCNSIACPVGSFSTRQDKDGLWPCEQCHFDYVNPYLGAKTCFVLDQVQIIYKLYESTNGDGWVGDFQSWRDRDIPLCNWSGIGCSEDGHIISLVIPSSNLFGQIPENLGFLRHLQRLDLSSNDLTGKIPSALQFAPLEEIDVGGNRLEGFVPPSLCEKGGLNHNGDGGLFSCDNVACATGTYSTTGRAVEGECMPCESSTYLGSTVCEHTFALSKPDASTYKLSAGLLAVVVTFAVLLYGVRFLIPCGALLLLHQTRKNHEKSEAVRSTREDSKREKKVRIDQLQKNKTQWIDQSIGNRTAITEQSTSKRTIRTDQESQSMRSMLVDGDEDSTRFDDDNARFELIEVPETS